ncbi:MAG: hypothetical protein PUD25_02875 [Bacilli bacterium]|nr:hypothetical protein [Bacilli bacterium]
MKKLVHYFIFVILFSVFLPIRGVFADNTDYKISYDITNFSVGSDGDTIHFEGWSFLSHMDNYGGINMDTYIAAYTGSWDSRWRDQNTCNDIKNKKCYSVVTTPSAEDLYFIRCTDTACSDSFRAGIVDDLDNNKKTFAFSGCMGGTYTTKSTTRSITKTGSHCTYHNVGFKVDMKISDILEKLNNTENDIHFRIITIAKGGKTKKRLNRVRGDNIKKDDTDIGVIPNSCSNIFNQTCTKNKDYTTTYYKNSTVGNIQVKEKKERTITVDGLNDIVVFTAVNASGSRNSSYTIGRDQFFNPGHRYRVEDTTIMNSNWKNWKGDGTGKFSGRLLKITGSPKSNRNDYGWAWSAWVKTSGALKLKIKDKTNTTCTGCTCDDNALVACVGKNCTYTDASKKCPKYTNVLSLKKTQKGSSEFNGCSSVNDRAVSSSEEVEKKYWLRIPKNIIDNQINNNNIFVNPVTLHDYNNKADYKNKLVFDGNYYWFPVKIKVLVEFRQTFNLNLNFISSKVDAGGSFPFSFNYKTNVSFFPYQYDVSHGTSEYNTYDATYTFEVINLKHERSKRQIAIGLSEGDEIFTSPNSNNEKYSIHLLKDIANTASKKDLKNSDKTVTVDFPDTNNPNTRNIDAGDFECKNNFSECDYLLKQAYVKKDGSGKVQYSQTEVPGFDKLQSQGSRYIVSPIWKTGDKFEFKIEAKFGLPNTKFNYNATCSLDTITNKIHSTNYIKYRSIDTSNPFPDSSKIPENWKEYQKVDSNFSRIVNTSFNDKVVNYQTGFFGSSIKNTLKELENSNKIGSYSSYKDVTSSGSDKLITDTDIFSVKSVTSGQNYCLTGQFNENCNKLLVG